MVLRKMLFIDNFCSRFNSLTVIYVPLRNHSQSQHFGLVQRGLLRGCVRSVSVFFFLQLFMTAVLQSS